mmetsp:Transcript_12676/g.32093  ORF Transcript_12676/g.32093 Transcript_12676/m.32093 type:complete len:208 (+) Transcript_12676:1058-1681(+)
MPRLQRLLQRPARTGRRGSHARAGGYDGGGGGHVAHSGDAAAGVQWRLQVRAACEGATCEGQPEARHRRANRRRARRRKGGAAGEVQGGATARARDAGQGGGCGGEGGGVGGHASLRCAHRFGSAQIDWNRLDSARQHGLHRASAQVCARYQRAARAVRVLAVGVAKLARGRARAEGVEERPGRDAVHVRQTQRTAEYRVGRWAEAR